LRYLFFAKEELEVVGFCKEGAWCQCCHFCYPKILAFSL
jgi:hypothetical protein